ncbi:SMP-30/gluconolactonase/LRE family protein [Marinobacter hydrocarbonoclasticus]|nr:SMP-30/gluconolactonase/LRE family protein [Marinobacter nauticus]
MKRRVWLFSVLASALAYLSLWPVSPPARQWQPSAAIEPEALPSPSLSAGSLHLLPLPEGLGPEDLALSPQGNLVTGLENGTLWEYHSDAGWRQLDDTGGRPLGLEFGADGTLYIADALKGLLARSPDGNITQLVSEFMGVPLGFVDDVELDSDGRIYFTDASAAFPASVFGVEEASLRDLLAHSASGRLFRFDPADHSLTLLMDGLSFANGVTLSHDGNSVLVSETGRYRIWRYHLKGPKAGEQEVMIEHLPGFPDNISRSADGGYWVGLVAPRDALLDALGPYPAMRDLIRRLPAQLRPEAKRHGQLLELDKTGQIRQRYDDANGRFAFITGALATPGRIYLTSLKEPAIAALPLP